MRVSWSPVHRVASDRLEVLSPNTPAGGSKCLNIVNITISNVRGGLPSVYIVILMYTGVRQYPCMAAA